MTDRLAILREDRVHRLCAEGPRLAALGLCDADTREERDRLANVYALRGGPGTTPHQREEVDRDGGAGAEQTQGDRASPLADVSGAFFADRRADQRRVRWLLRTVGIGLLVVAALTLGVLLAAALNGGGGRS